MKLWYIERIGITHYDEYSDAVIRAESEEDARQRMQKYAGFRHRETEWIDSSNATCVELEQHGRPGIVCASYHAG